MPSLAARARLEGEVAFQRLLERFDRMELINLDTLRAAGFMGPAGLSVSRPGFNAAPAERRGPGRFVAWSTGVSSAEDGKGAQAWWGPTSESESRPLT